MARHAYLSRMALGRSAYELPEHSSSPQPQVPSANEQSDSYDGNASPPNQLNDSLTLSALALEPDADSQQYNERGRPINERSRALARDMRAAQNDVLACVGVCVRSAPSGPSLSDVHDTRTHEMVASETMYGSIVGIVGILAKYAGVWWTSSLRDRLLVFAFPSDLTFGQLITKEHRRSGPMAFLFAGFPAHLLSLILNDGNIWSTVLVELIDDAVLTSEVPRRQRRLWQRIRRPFRWLLAVTIEVLFTPILVHVNLQKLNFVPARQILPSWRGFSPTLFALSVPYSQHPSPRSLHGAAFWALSFAGSPLVLLQAWRQVMNQAQSILYPLFASSILIPDNPDRFTLDIERREDVEAPEGKPLRAFQGLLATIGWGDSSNKFSWPSPSGLFSRRIWPRGGLGNQQSTNEVEQIDISHTPLATPPIPASPQDQQNNGSTNQPTRVDTTTPVHPDESPDNRAVSPSSSNGPSDDLPHANDATIRIAPGSVASGTVNLEIALPDDTPAHPNRRNSVILADNGAAHHSVNGDQNDSTTVAPSHRQHRRTANHRVTPLSEEPADMLATLLNGFVSGWLFIPVKGLILRRIAAVALAHNSPGISQANTPLYPMFSRFGGPWTPIWAREVGREGVLALTGKVALCCAAEMAISFALWGVQWSLITWTGKRWYQWGKL